MIAGLSTTRTRSTNAVSSSKRFSEAYERVRALTVEPRLANDGVKMFLAAEDELKETQKDSSMKGDSHSVLAIAKLLQPLHVGFDCIENAKSAHKEASACLDSKESSAEALSLAIFVELRILPLLVRSQEASEKDLATARETALSFAESLNCEKSFSTFAGAAIGALGLSYYQHEHDRDRALQYLSNARNLLLRHKESQLNNSIISVTLWDTGMCYESLAEEAIGEEAIRLYRQSRLHYESALSFAEKSSWILYRAFALLGIGATFAREAELSAQSISRSASKSLIKKAIRKAESGLSIMRRWSSIEADMLGGSFLSQLYLQLGALCKGNEKRKLLNRSFEIASKAERAYESVSRGRYSTANFGDVYFGLAQYYFEAGSNNLQRKNRAKHLLRSLEHCLKSQKFFDEERHADRALQAFLLGAKVCKELAKLGENVDYYLNLGESQVQKSKSICERRGWKVQA